MEKQEMEMKWKLETETGNNTQSLIQCSLHGLPNSVISNSCGYTHAGPYFIRYN